MIAAVAASDIALAWPALRPLTLACEPPGLMAATMSAIRFKARADTEAVPPPPDPPDEPAPP